MDIDKQWDLHCHTVKESLWGIPPQGNEATDWLYRWKFDSQGNVREGWSYANLLEWQFWDYKKTGTANAHTAKDAYQKRKGRK